jgi:calcium-dependent protein kinase
VPEATVLCQDESSKISIQPEDALIFEANETLELAESQLAEGMNEAASRNFHTATVYYRVLESMVPNISLDLHAKLEYAAARTRQCSQLIQNFVQEHFQGTRCSDIYDIIKSKRLGKGSYGSVYLCKHKKTGDSFAVKIINVTRINSHSLRKLHLEIAIMKALDHPHIIKLRGVFFGRRTVSLVMDLCQGGELFDQLTGNQQHKKGFPECYAARLIRFMISSIGYLHSQGIMHRDIKLENFLFESRDPSSSLSLIDFGLSKHYCAFETMHQVVGSAYYTAPEVLKGSYDYRCDIWSLGIVAYMLMTGSPPFNGANSEAIHAQIQNNEADFSPRKFPRASPLAIDFLKMMLQKDPEKRISLDEANRHPFVLQANEWNEGEALKMVLSPDIVTSLKNFSHLSKFKRLTLELLAFNMNTSQIAGLRQEFNAIDVDSSGTISLEEFKKSLVETHGLTAEGAEDIFNSVDVDKSTFINYNEFVAAAMGRRISIEEDHLMLAFDTLDVHKTGKLNAEGIKAALGDSLNDEDVSEMMKEISYDNNGDIDYIEFAKFWKNFIVTQKLAPFRRVAHTVRRMTSAIKAFEFSVKSSRQNSIEAAGEGGTSPGASEKGSLPRRFSSSMVGRLGIL